MKQRQTFHILLRLLLFGGAVASSVYIWAEYGCTFSFYASLLFGVIVAISILQFIGKTNRQIAYFFDAIENNDSSITFPQRGNSPSFHKLYDSLNRVNEKIQKAKIDSGINEQYFRTIIEHSATGIISFDETGTVQVLNSAAKELLNCGSVQHISNFQNQEICTYLSTVANNSSDTIITKVAGAVCHLKFNTVQLSFFDKTMKITSIQDISDEIDTKELESWIKLIRVLTHEIMNSIAPITSIAGTLRKYFEPGHMTITESVCQDTGDGLEVIEEQSKRLTHFVQSYRTLAKLPKPELDAVSVESLFAKVKYLFAEKAQQLGTTIEMSVSPFDLEIYADKNLINHVLVNLVKNALQSGGNRIRMSANRQLNGTIILTIADNGCGIEQELIDKIFIPFFTTKEEGTGIGLSLARQIMHQHKGSIEIQQSNGETQFLIIFKKLA